MKRLATLLTLIWFMIASQMQSIHAMDMWAMDTHENMAHLMSNNESIFCNSDPVKQNQNDCYKELIWDRSVNIENKQELKNDKKISYPNQIFYVNKSNLNWLNLSLELVNYSPPEGIFKQKSDYQNLTWIIKNLN